MTAFKDLFSVQAKDYAKYRPTYPAGLYTYLASLTTPKKIVWDVGTGNGQAAIELAKDFEQVNATDPSEKQISEAQARPNISYHIEAAETPSLTKASVNLITVAQAFHWFDHARFAEACKAVAAPGAHLAVWTYAKATVEPELDQVIDRLYTGILDRYWEKERRLVEQGYKTIQMPFKEIHTPAFNLEAEWSLEQLLGYFKTWSAMQSYLKKNDSGPIQKSFEDISSAWGSVPTRKVSWPLSLRVWEIA